MKKYFILCFLVIFSGCVQENLLEKTGNNNLWVVNAIATIDDGKVELRWQNPLPSPLEFRMIPVVIPDKMEIYISENDMSNFRKLTEMNGVDLNNSDNFTYTVDRLQNGKNYFFYSVSNKKGVNPTYSDTIMAIPNKKREFETLMIITDGVHGYVSVGQHNNKIAFTGVFTEKYSDVTTIASSYVAISNMDGSEKEVIDIYSGNPCWSPENDKIAFNTKNKNVDMPSHIALFDYNEKTITHITNGDNSDFAPAFSKNGEFLLFHSTKNAPAKNPAYMTVLPTNIWSINLKTLEAFQISDISKISLITAERPSWIDNDRFLFHGINSGGKYQLYESSVSTKQVNKVINSQWNDYIPSISPNQQKIAFISDRSRQYQIWIYHTDTKKYSQLTGYSTDEFVSPYSNIEWLDDSTIIYTRNGNQSVKQKIE